MNFSTIGDLSQTFLFRGRNAELRNQIQHLQTEVTTGLTSNTREHLNASYAQLTDIERSLSVLQSYKTVGDEARITTDLMQKALTAIHDQSSELAANLHLAAQVNGATSLELASQQAKAVFSGIVSNLNASVAGSSLFAGSATDGPALIDADTLLANLRGALSGQTTLTGIDGQLDAWFDMPGGGFETLAYLGGADAGSPFKLADDTKISVSLKADHQDIRAVLKSVAKAALAMDPALGFSQGVAQIMVSSSADALTSMQPDLVDLAAGVGLAQELIEDTTARNESAMTSLRITRNELLGVDGYEAASSLEAAQSQIELMYAVTVRASRLSLLEFMR